MKLNLNSLNKAFAWAMGPIGIIATVLGLVNDAPGAISLINDQNGNIVLSYRGENVKENSERNIIVCLDHASSAGMLTGIYPTVSNNTRYGVNNLAMRYDIRTENVSLEPTDYYTLIKEEENTFTLKYKDKTLPAFSTVERPFKKVNLEGNHGRLHMKARTSYDGIDHPLQYGVCAEFMVIPYPDNQNFNDWKLNCQQQFLSKSSTLRECDVYYLSQKYGQEQEINYLLAPKATSATKSEAESKNDIQLKCPVKESGVPANSKTKDQAAKQKPQVNNQLPYENTAKAIPAIKEHPAINLRFRKDATSDKVDITIPDFKKDTMLMVLALTEDAITQEKHNELWCIDYKKEKNARRWQFLCKENHRLLDYALCAENPQLQDSVKIYKSGTISNPLLRTIAFTGKRIADNGNEYIHYEFLSSKDNNKADSRGISVDGLKDIHFYELAENLLIEKFKPVDQYEWIRNYIHLGNLFGLGLSAVALFFVLFFAVSRLIDERKNIDSMRDVRHYLLDEFNESSMTKALLSLGSFTALIYIGTVLIIFIIAATCRFFI